MLNENNSSKPVNKEQVIDLRKLMQDMRKRRNIEVVTPEFERLCQRYGVVYPYGLIWRYIFSNRKLSKGAK